MKTKQVKQNKVKKYGIVIPHALYVREGADQSFNPIKTTPIIYQGEKIEIVGNIIINLHKEEWYHIKIEDNTYGYVKAEFIKTV